MENAVEAKALFLFTNKKRENSRDHVPVLDLGVHHPW